MEPNRAPGVRRVRGGEITGVRCVVDDVEWAIAYYTEFLDFELLTDAAPAFAHVRRGSLQLLLVRVEGA